MFKATEKQHLSFNGTHVVKKDTQPVVSESAQNWFLGGIEERVSLGESLAEAVTFMLKSPFSDPNWVSWK